MEINLQHINTGLLSLLSAWELFKVIAKATPGKKDDKVVAKVEGAVADGAAKIKAGVDKTVALVQRKSALIWAVVEVADKTGLLPDKAQKPLEFLKRLRAAIPNMTPEAEAEAQKIAAELSQEAKNP